MASYGKTKGAAFERLIRSYFNDAGITAKNPARTGFDGSDVVLGDDDFMNLEAKSRKTRSLPAWFRQAEKDATTAYWGVVHKRPGKGKAEDQYITISPHVASLLRISVPADRENKSTAKINGGKWLRIDSAQAKSLEQWLKDYELDGSWTIIHGKKREYVTMPMGLFHDKLINSGLI